MIALKQTAKSNKRKNDLIFVGALLLVFCAVGALIMLFGKTGDTVTVTVDRVFFGEYPLNENRTVEIRTGDSLNVLVIEDGKAKMASATCPDGICASHRPIFRDGESIICLPNKVVVTVSSKNTSAPDIVA